MRLTPTALGLTLVSSSLLAACGGSGDGASTPPDGASVPPDEPALSTDDGSDGSAGGLPPADRPPDEATELPWRAKVTLPGGKSLAYSVGADGGVRVASAPGSLVAAEISLELRNVNLNFIQGNDDEIAEACQEAYESRDRAALPEPPPLSATAWDSRAWSLQLGAGFFALRFDWTRSMKESVLADAATRFPDSVELTIQPPEPSPLDVAVDETSFEATLAGANGQLADFLSSKPMTLMNYQLCDLASGRVLVEIGDEPLGELRLTLL